MIKIICIVLSVAIFVSTDDCKPSITTASGPDAPQKICSGQLVYHEPFDDVNKTKWAPLVTFWDGGVRQILVLIKKMQAKIISTLHLFCLLHT